MLGYAGKINQQEIDREPDDRRYSPIDVIGKAVVERSLERELRGMPGEETVVRDSAGVVRERKRLRNPVVGRDVRLTIDVGTQRLAETSLLEGLVAARRNIDVDHTDQPIRATAGAIVVLTRRRRRACHGELPDVRAQRLRAQHRPGAVPAALRRSGSRFAPNQPSGHRPLPARVHLRDLHRRRCAARRARRAGAALPGRRLLQASKSQRPPEMHVAKRRRHEVRAQCPPRRHQGLERLVLLQPRLPVLSASKRTGQWHPGISPELGLGARTNIRWPSERPGAVPDRNYRKLLHDQNPTAFPNGRWTTGDFINVAIGHGEVLTTPLQLTRTYAAIANGGTLLQPRIELAVGRRQDWIAGTAASTAPATRAPNVPSLSAAAGAATSTLTLDDPSTNPLPPIISALAPITRPPIVLGNVNVPDEIRSPILQGLTGVVRADSGTASAAFRGFPLDVFPIPGKTGTAQKSAEQDYALFTAFGPVPDPRYVVTVVLEQGGFGRQAAAVTRRVFDELAGFPVNDVETFREPDGNAEHRQRPQMTECSKQGS